MGIRESQDRFGPPCSGENPQANPPDKQEKDEEMKAEEEVLWNG